MYLSVIVPVYNEEGNISKLHEEIVFVCKKLGKDFEIIYINDGSKDKTLVKLKSLENITIINFNRNYGQATAFDAGFKACSGDLVVSLDGDGQNDPNDIPKLLNKLQDEDLDVVAGWRQVRQDKKSIKILTLIGRRLRRFFISDIVHDTGCSLRVYKQEAVKSLDIGGEMHRYILALLKWKGFSIGEVVVNDRARVYGQSHYNCSKAVRGFVDLIYIWFLHKYSQRPLHLFGYLSLFSFLFGVISGVMTIYDKLALGLSLNRNGWTLITFFFLLSGIMFFSFGIIINLLMKTMFNSSPVEKRYYIREIIKK
ncbi:MAG: glycosyltransferase family 2 protein [Candidatus Magasanikiibacteriota bacterium]